MSRSKHAERTMAKQKQIKPYVRRRHTAAGAYSE